MKSETVRRQTCDANREPGRKPGREREKGEKEKGRKEKGERRKEKGERRKEKGERRKEKERIRLSYPLFALQAL